MKRLGLVLCALWSSLAAGVLVNPYRFAAPYVAGTAVADGTNDNLERTGAITGFADGTAFHCSFWYRADVDSVGRVIAEWTTGTARVWRISHNSTNVIHVEGRNAALTDVLNIDTTSTVTVASGWVHIYICVDLTNTANRKIYFNGAAQTLTINTYNTSGVIEFLPASDPRYYIFANANRLQDVTGALAEFVFHLTYLDAPDSFAAGGKPIALGALGTGAVIYLKDSGDSFALNYGTGEDFNVIGAFTTTTPP